MWTVPRIPALRLLVVVVLHSVSSDSAIADSHLRLWGDFTSAYRQRESLDGDAENMNWQNTGTISASSYIWRPWFALINGSLSLSVEDTEEQNRAKSEDEFTTGDVFFNLFPTSRFPFSAYAVKNRDRFDSDASTRVVERTEYGASQRYRSQDGRHIYLAEVQTFAQESSLGNDVVADGLLLSANDRLGDHLLDTDVKLDRVDSRSSNQQAESRTIALDHAYGKGSNWSIENLLSNTSIENDFSETSVDLETSQLASFATWQPRDRRDLKLTGSLRFFETLQEQRSETVMTEFGKSEAQTANLNQGLVYEYSDNLQFSQSANANLFEDENGEVFTANEAVAARYVSDRVETGLGDYGWSLGSTYNNVHGDVEPRQSLATQFSHSLLNDFSDASNYQLRSNLNQALTYESSSDGADSKDISHAYSLTWSSTALGYQNLARFAASDSRSLNGDTDSFQLVNLQYTSTKGLTRYSQLTGNATLQYTRQETEGRRSEQTATNGQLEYRRSRVFGVPGMFFTSLLKLSERRSETERLIEDNDSASQASLENALFYRIGRLETRLDLDLVKISDAYDRIIMFQIKRSFGDL